MRKEKSFKKTCILLALTLLMNGFTIKGLKKITVDINESVYYEQEFELYDLASDKISNLYKELNLTTSTECFLMFDFLLYNGYLSVDNAYTYDNKNLYDIFGAHGYDVLTGRACCRNSSELFNDVLKKCGYNSYFVTCNASDNNKFKPGVNHAINIVEDDGKVNYFDTTYRHVFDSYDNKITSISTYDKDHRFYVKPVYTLMFNYSLEDVIDTYKLLLNDTEYLTEEYIKYEEQIVYNIIINNKDTLLKFKDDFKENITDKVKKIS